MESYFRNDSKEFWKYNISHKRFRIWCYRKYFLTTFTVWPFIFKMLILECPENMCICVSVHMSFLSVPGGTLQRTRMNILQMHPLGTCPSQVRVSTQLVCTKYVHIQRGPILFFLCILQNSVLFFPALLSYNWQNCNIFKVYNNDDLI